MLPVGLVWTLAKNVFIIARSGSSRKYHVTSISRDWKNNWIIEKIQNIFSTKIFVI
jgi:hypothetical protein